MKSTHLAATSLLSALSYGSPPHAVSNELVAARQAAGSYFAITGASGGVYPRLELRDLEKTGEMWNLYLLAMTNFQAMNQNEIASWYQIAGMFLCEQQFPETMLIIARQGSMECLGESPLIGEDNPALLF